MNNLSITQEFVLCILNEKGKIKMFTENEVTASLIVTSVMELAEQGIVSISDDKKKIITIQKELPETIDYLHPLFNEMEALKKITFSKLGEKYSMSSKRFSRLLKSVCNSLNKAGVVTEEIDKGMLGTTVRYIPIPGEVTKIVEGIRAEFLEDGKLSSDTIILAALLDRTHFLKDYFSKYEKETFKHRLSEINDEDVSKLIKQIQDQIEAMTFVPIITVM